MRLPVFCACKMLAVFYKSYRKNQIAGLQSLLYLCPIKAYEVLEIITTESWCQNQFKGLHKIIYTLFIAFVGEKTTYALYAVEIKIIWYKIYFCSALIHLSNTIISSHIVAFTPAIAFFPISLEYIVTNLQPCIAWLERISSMRSCRNLWEKRYWYHFDMNNSFVANWETIARNCESLLKKNVCCGILEEVEFILKMLMEKKKWVLYI